jgi:hypothetical protein
MGTIFAFPTGALNYRSKRDVERAQRACELPANERPAGFPHEPEAARGAIGGVLDPERLRRTGFRFRGRTWVELRRGFAPVGRIG